MADDPQLEADPAPHDPTAGDGGDTPRTAPAATAAAGSALVLSVTLAVVFAVAAAILGVLLAQAGDDTEDALDDLRGAAGEFGEVLVSYDFHDPEAHRDAVLDRSTGSFRDEYDAAFEQGLGDLITELQATSEGHVKEVFLTEVQDDQALAVVVLDIVTEGAAGANPLYDVYIRLTLIQVDGTWLVDDVTDLSFGGDAAPGPGVTTDTTATTTTSVP